MVIPKIIPDGDISSGRRISETSTSGLSPVGGTYASYPVSTLSAPNIYTVDINVGSLRYDDSKDDISLVIIGKNKNGITESTDFMTLGNGWTKGETRSLRLYDVKDIVNIEKLVLTTNGKNGLRFDSIVVDRFAGVNTKGISKGHMDSQLKCRGLKREGTYSCSMDVAVEFQKRPNIYEIEVTVHTKSYSDSPNEISMQLFHGAKETSKFSLGKDWGKGEKRLLAIYDPVDILSIDRAVLSSSGTNGVLFQGLSIDRLAGDSDGGWSEFDMGTTMLKCAGKKSDNTYTCDVELFPRQVGFNETVADNFIDPSCK